MFQQMKITSKLLVSFLILIVFVLIISVMSYFSYQRLSKMSDLTSDVHHVDESLLQLRHSEKDFFVRGIKSDVFFETGAHKYLSKQKRQYQTVHDEIDDLLVDPDVAELKMLPLLKTMKKDLEEYQVHFLRLVSLYKELGFKNHGLRGRLRQDVLDIEGSHIPYDKALLLTMRQHEKDFFLQLDMKYAHQLRLDEKLFQKSIETSKNSSENKAKLLTLLQDYVVSFDKVMVLEKQIGLTAETGLHGQMSRAFHRIEPVYKKAQEVLYAYIEKSRQTTFLYLLVFVLVSVFLSLLLAYLMARSIITPIRQLRRSAEKFKEGDLDHRFNVYSKDEIGQLADTFNDLIENNKALADAAKNIGGGDFETAVVVRGEKDVLGQSLSKMKTSLQSLDTENKKQIWVKTQVSKITNLSQGITNLQDLLQGVISELASILKAGHGAFYLAEKGTDEKSVILRLLGSYAYSDRKGLSNQFKLGEGLVGQCAQEKQTILITDIPDDYIQVKSGLGNKKPECILVLPVMHEGEVLGVIELASFQLFDTEQRLLLDETARNLGIIINNVESHQKTEILLTESQNLTEELQTQQEELRASNEELEEKTKILKENEEELKAQSEELQAANEELEEKSERLEVQNESIAKKNSEVEQARKEVEQRAKDLALASKYKSEFLANMSHELRTPLNSLLILSKDLEKNKTGNLTEKQVESAKVIHDGGQDLLTLINDILDLSKVESGKLELDISALNIHEFLNGLKPQFDPIVKEKGLSFEVEIDPEIEGSFQTDELRLAQVIKNLFFNSVKFTPSGGIKIKAFKPSADLKLNNKNLLEEGAIAFSVVDTGIGIPKGKQREIFEAFQQGDGSTNRNYGGTGLGLAISRAISELLGGELLLESEEGEGCTFTIVVPGQLTRVEKVGNERKNSPGIPASEEAIDQALNDIPEKPAMDIQNVTPRQFIPDDRSEITPETKSILIIEDDSAFAKILMERSRESGYLCLSAGDGHSGLALAKEYQPNAIILDLGLPDVDGLKVLEQLKFELATRHIPIHIVSGREETPEFKQKGAIGYLLKPGDSEGLSTIFNKIESVLSSKIKNVLVVEDDSSSQLAIAKLIENDGLSLDQALSAIEAKEKILSNAYDCVILDLSLPDFSGFELLKQLKAEAKELPPVVVYTGRELSEDEHLDLQQYTSSIVVKGAESPERLLDEISLFLHSVEADLPENQKQVIQMLHKSEEVLLNRRILLVDDDVRNVFALSSTLEGYGLDVIVASNGKVAIDKLHSEAGIELVIMDIMMPVMDGYEAMTEIRKETQYKDLPIIALTAKAMAGDREKCIQSGANDYITKPVEVEKLVSMMKVWLFK